MGALFIESALATAQHLSMIASLEETVSGHLRARFAAGEILYFFPVPVYDYS